MISKHNKIDIVFDSGSQANLISENIVKSLNLETAPHHKLHPLGWVCDNAKLQVIRKCKLRLIITVNFIDEVELDFVSLDICGMALGSSYLYDIKSIFHRHENKYHLFKNGVENIARAHSKKIGLSLVNATRMKRQVNHKARNMVR